MVNALLEAGTANDVTRLLERNPLSQIKLDSPESTADLLKALQEAGLHGEAAALATRAAEHARPEDSEGVATLVEALLTVGATDAVTRLLERNPVSQIKLDSSNWPVRLLRALQKAGAHGEVATLATRAVEDLRLQDTHEAWVVVDALLEAGTANAVTRLLERNPVTQIKLDSPESTRSLLAALHEAGACDEAAGLAAQIAEQAWPEDAYEALVVVDALLGAGASPAATRLLERNLATQIMLDKPYWVAGLLDKYRETGARRAVHALAAHIAENATVDSPDYLTTLVRALRDAGAIRETLTLLRRTARATHPVPMETSAIRDSFPAVDWADAPAATATLLYGPGYGNQRARPWTWADLCPPES